MAKKTDQVMEALSHRGEMKDGKGGPGKKGVNLLGIVKKLSEKRKAKAEKSEGEKE
jgi:hypothetical protein